jgi:hypothetical protein
MTSSRPCSGAPGPGPELIACSFQFASVTMVVRPFKEDGYTGKPCNMPLLSTSCWFDIIGEYQVSTRVEGLKKVQRREIDPIRTSTSVAS